MAWVSISFDWWWFWNCARILQNSDFSLVVSTCQQLSLWIKISIVGTVNCIYISSIPGWLKDALNWPSKSRTPGGPFLISGLCSPTRYLRPSLRIPEQQFIWATCRMNHITVFGEIKVFNVTGMLDFRVFLFYLSSIPCIYANESQMIADG